MSDNQFIKFFRAYTAGGGGGGGGGVDIKVKVSGTDTTTDYLSNKLSSADGSVTFTILNPGGNETYDVSVAPIVTTVAGAQAFITGNLLAAGRLYLITDAFSNTCQVFLWAVTNNQFDQNGWGLFSNTNTTPIEAFMKYDVVSDVVYEVWVPSTNIRIIQTPGSGASAMTSFPLVTNANSYNVTIEDSTITGALVLDPTKFTLKNCVFRNAFCVWNNFANHTITDVVVEASELNTDGTFDVLAEKTHIVDASIVNLNCSGANGILSRCEIGPSANVSIISSASSASIQGATIGGGNSAVTCTDSTISGGLYRGTVTLTNGSVVNRCQVFEGGTLTLDSSTFNTCKVGMGKTVAPVAGYSTTNGFSENLDSTFEVFLTPDVTGVLDMAGYQFAGIVRVGTSGVPAAWDLKEIVNFPTDHIFCIVPADANTIDAYDAGAGGVNIYLSTAAVVTYDGTKDDTLVVRSGLNNYFRVFQIGGWQAPSA